MHQFVITRREPDFAFSSTQHPLYRCILALLLALFGALSPRGGSAQVTPEPHTTPALGGSFVADTAVPTVISPSAQGAEYFVLNQDLSLLTHSSVDTSLNGTCAAPSGFAATSATPRTFVNDTANAYFTAQSSANANAMVSGFSFINTGLCQPVTGPAIVGGAPTYTFSTNDVYHGRYYVLSGFNGNGADTLTLSANLNNALSGGTYVQKLKTVSLDTGAQYTSMLTDVVAGASGTGLTAITELKTATSPGNLWVFNPTGQVAYQIMGPGGVPLPAVGSFIIPAQTDGGGSLLVLVNQDNLTASNLGNPPQDKTPFTIIDLGQLLQTFTINPYGGTVTLPFVTQISATVPYFAMLGAAYNPVTRLVYAVVGGGSATAVTGNVISYDPFNPATPNETVVADVSNISFSFGGYPQLALNAAGGTLQILTPAPQTLYSVGTKGTGNTAVAVPGTTFPDTNFKPTMIAANPLLGETYVASGSGQVDVLKVPGSALQVTLSLQGPDIAVANQSYSLRGLSLAPTLDSALNSAVVTVTATPAGGGTPFTFATSTVGSFRYPGGSVTGTFPATGVYTLVASAAASANYPAFSTNPINVKVATNSLAGVYPTTLLLSVPASSAATSVTATVTLGNSTYAPTGHINVTDATGAQVGTYTFTGGAMAPPITIPLTLTKGASTLTATYSGDAQNAPTTSAAVQITVGTIVTPTLTLSNVGPTALAATSNTGNVTFGSSTTTAPTGTITIYYVPSGSTTQTVLTNVAAAAAFSASGASFTYNSPPTPGSYTLYATYPGDSNYSAATSVGASLTVQVALATTLTVSAPTTAATNGLFSINIKLASATSTQTPSGTINVTAKLAGATTSTNIGIVDASQAYATGGNSFNANFPTAGVWTITASFFGDANFKASSGTTTITVNPSTAVATTLKITAPANVATNTSYTAVVALTAASTLTNGPSGLVTLVVTSPSGAVVSTINTTAASAFLGSGYSASIPAATAAGTYTLTASYAGDSNYSASSIASSVIVGSTLSTTGIGISGQTNVTLNVPSNLTIRLIPQTGVTATPTGNVVITSTNPSGVTATLGTITAAQALASGGDVATINYSLLGNFTVTATYSGDANFSGSSSSLVITVSGPSSTTAVGISGPTNVTLNVPSPLTIRLIPQTGATATPTGNVVITSVNPSGVTATLGTITAAQAMASGGDVATINYSIPGNFTVTAAYAGDANFTGSMASIVVTVSPAVVIATSLTLKTPPTATVGTPYTATVILTPASVSTPSPSGSVTLTSTLNGTSTPVATFTAAQALTGVNYMVPANAYGSVVLTAAYAGDANYSAAPAVSNTVAVGTATGVASIVNVTSVSTTGPGIPTVATVLLNAAAGDKYPHATGTITVSIALQGGAPTVVATLDAALINVTPSPTSSVTILYPAATGTYTLTATYSGDSIFSSSTFSTIVSDVVEADALSIAGPATGPAPSSSITFNLFQYSTASAISGNVTISSTCDGSAGPSVTIPAILNILGPLNPVNFSLAFTKPGTCTLVANYPGDVDNLPATSPGFTITLTSSGTPGFTSFVTGTTELTLIEPTVTSTTLSLAALNGFTTPVAFTYIDAATNAAPGNLVFTITNPTSGTALTTVVPGTTGTKVVLTVAYGTGARLDLPSSLRDTGILACVLLCAGCFSVRRRYPLKRMRLLTVALFLCSTLALTGCDGPMGCGSQPVNTRTIHVVATPVNGSQNAAPQTVDIVVLN